MKNKSKILFALAGAGLIGMLSGCGQEELQIVPIASTPHPLSENRTAVDHSTDNGNSSSNNSIHKDGAKDVSKDVSGDHTPINPANTDSSVNSNTANKTDDSGVELIALANSEEEARQIAALYGITFKSYSYGVAVFTTNADPQALIQMGIDKGYPLLSLNDEMYLFEN